MKSLATTILTLLLLHGTTGFHQKPVPGGTPGQLQITALTASPNGQSVIECWELTDPSRVLDVPGNVGSILNGLGPIESASHVVTKPRYPGGWHKAPAVQYFSFLCPPRIWFCPIREKCHFPTVTIAMPPTRLLLLG